MENAPMTTQTQTAGTGLRGSLRSLWFKRRWLLIGLAVLVVVGLGTIFLLTRAPADLPYETEPLRRSDLEVTVTAVGNLQPTQLIEIGSEVSGLITEVFVDNNDRVRAGQPLALIDPTRLRNTLSESEATLAASRATVRAAEASAEDAAANLARLEDIHQRSGGATPAQAELDTARAEQARSAAEVDNARAAVRQNEARVASAQIDLSRTTIRSPASGVVLSRRINPGQTLAASFQTPVLFTVAEDLSTMRLDVRVDEADIGQVEAGQRARFAVDAFPGERFQADVERVDLGADSAETEIAGGEVIAYAARLAVANTNGRLRPGMTATADIVTARFENRWVVPLAALRFRPPAQSQGGLQIQRPEGEQDREQQTGIGRGSRQTLHVLRDGALIAVPVTVLAVSGSVAAVDGDGLRAGESLVTAVRDRAP